MSLPFPYWPPPPHFHTYIFLLPVAGGGSGLTIVADLHFRRRFRQRRNRGYRSGTPPSFARGGEVQTRGGGREGRRLFRSHRREAKIIHCVLEAEVEEGGSREEGGWLLRV